MLPATAQTPITASVTLSMSGYIQSNPTNNFIIKAANIPVTTIMQGTASYESNWASNLKTLLGVNTLRLQAGGEGDLRFNMVQHPTTWANSLETLLTSVNAAGFRCYFYTLGDEWGGEFGITDQGSNYMPIATAKTYIDKLAGQNSLNHNFITDPRIAVWSVCNEVDFGNPASPNANYQWAIQMADYIRSKGGQVTIPYPRINAGWDQYFQQVEPMLRGHVDYLETHAYGIWQLGTQYSLGNNQYNWAGWETYLKGALSNIVTYRGSFDMNHVILGEFGLWRGAGSDGGLTAYTFTDQNRIDYYTHYFKVIKELGFKNVCFHYAIEENSQYVNPYEARYGMITPVPDGIHFFDPAGQPYPGCEVIKANFG